MMKKKEKRPILDSNSPIPEAKEQKKTKSDRTHIDPIETEAFIIVSNSGGKGG